MSSKNVCSNSMVDSQLIPGLCCVSKLFQYKQFANLIHLHELHVHVRVHLDELSLGFGPVRTLSCGLRSLGSRLSMSRLSTSLLLPLPSSISCISMVTSRLEVVCTLASCCDVSSPSLLIMTVSALYWTLENILILAFLCVLIQPQKCSCSMSLAK